MKAALAVVFMLPEGCLLGSTATGHIRAPSSFDLSLQPSIAQRTLNTCAR